jgi:REP-associated tyrosine transposase
MEQVERPWRKIIRLDGYDYSRVGAYFVTICTQSKVRLFGDVVDGTMQLNDAGRMLEKWWVKLGDRFDNVVIDEYVVMPNHLHGVIILTDVGSSQTGAHAGAPLQGVLQWFKTMTTNEYIRGVKQNVWEPFPGKLWQRSYYDHIIRNDEKLNRARKYIMGNPIRWSEDEYNV